MMSGGMMCRKRIGGLIVLAIAGLVIAALVKFVFFR
jgi:hypothetical protein